MLLAFSKVLKTKKNNFDFGLSLMFQNNIASTVCTLNNFICILEQFFYCHYFLFAKESAYVHLLFVNNLSALGFGF